MDGVAQGRSKTWMALLLAGFDRRVMPIRSALRRIGVVIRQLEEGRPPPRDPVVAG